MVQIFFLTVLLLLQPVMGFAASESYEALDAQPIVGTDNVLKLQNQTCPLMSRPNKRKRLVQHGGVEYTLCCNKCVRSFNKNPEVYALSPETIDEARSIALGAGTVE